MAGYHAWKPRDGHERCMWCHMPWKPNPETKTRPLFSTDGGETWFTQPDRKTPRCGTPARPAEGR